MKLGKLAMGAVTGGLMCIGITELAAAQVDTNLRFDAEAIIDQMELSEETRRELVPLLERLDVVLEERREHWLEGDEILDELADTYDRIAETLSATELREFHWLMRQRAYGLRAGRPLGRYYYDDAGMRGYSNRWPAMRGARGYYGRGRPMRGARGFGGRGIPMRGLRGGIGWNDRPGWPPEGLYPKD